MNVLALETSGFRGSVAALRDDSLLNEISLPEGPGSAASLAPAIRQLLERVAWRPRDVTLVGVTVGPGSFTGLRVGVVTAKSWAYATGCQVVAVNTLEVVAMQAAGCTMVQEHASRGPLTLRAVLDAGRGQFFAASFTRGHQGELACEETGLVDLEAWVTSLSGSGDVVVVSGPGLARVADRLPPGVLVCPKEAWEPRAAIVGQLAVKHFRLRGGVDPWTLVPLYMRASAAEERRARGTRA